MATTADDVWRLLGELVEAQKETDRRFQETERLMREQRQESDRRFQETERLLKEQSQRVDKQLGKLGNRLGEFVEWQIRPAAVRLFKERGLDVHELYSGVSAQRPEGGLEIDLLVVNNTEAVLIEVKSKLTQSDVDEHLERLEKFKRLMPRYQNLKALGAVAGMVVPDDIALYAYRQGLFVLAQSGDNVIILNDPQFQPKAW
ncbi:MULTISPECIES: hypothetical protein [Microcystis]|jgi:hypothetical protein|uniref:DUF3782 domain-containing protein n=4 Tax=Microcystis TaxID=1125 RepID=B0JIF1_MICAN|nr:MULTISPECIES: hypothetical protein [Microcystis]MCE2661743.1 DUF3782 domain-containing protein [Microcystis sp. 53602_E8]MCZ8362623.1 DUF3782 domain-containing protein [Microcystis sp. LE19-251.1A]MDJ0527046.1 DUF3782 domain-containing protein [Microcystis sp. M53600_WE12]MDJ0546700.1 DUF3782 domain-containing protein [Microcystis sp. M53601_WE4]NCQ93452.1 DUF3782 domain-containing protein [Microcystis aeruginosa LG13-13]NCR06570.1 DUF3782 domain-containing protein [Microcystis aeruginosa 